MKYIYIDDPISSLDENNVIAIAHDLAQILKRYLNLIQNSPDKIKFIISSHHSLFFNVIYNELKKHKSSTYFLTKSSEVESCFNLEKTDETPFFYHLIMLSELQLAVHNLKLYTYHFNVLRSILEKTARFLGLDHFSNCLDFCKDKELYARALNLLSHGQYAIYEPREMVLDNKRLFGKVLKEFSDHYKFK